MDQGLSELVATAWRIHEQAQGEHIVRPSIPILFFGDLARYLTSDLRILSVGLNPSGEEFPVMDRFLRFPSARHFHPEGPRSDEDTDAYIGALSRYFDCSPYSRWFEAAFGAILAGAKAGYGRGLRRALHTDICSPLATSPTWSKLPSEDRVALLAEGTGLWHELCDWLQPDLVLISVARHHLASIRFDLVEPWRPVHRIERNTPYMVEGARYKLQSGKTPLFAFGQAAQLPFGTVSKIDSLRIGEVLERAARIR